MMCFLAADMNKTERANIMLSIAESLQKGKFRRNRALFAMLAPGALLAIIFSYMPMIGIVIAFEDYNPAAGFFKSAWVGLDNFNYMLQLPSIFQVIFNTVFIAVMKITLGLIVPITFALLLNELKRSSVKRTIQTAVYLPHFLSWVILGAILIDVLSPSQGIVNMIIKALGLKPVFFLGQPKIFPYVIAITDCWKEFGFGTIIYLAAITSVNPNLYEAAMIDGASRWKRVRHITLPCMIPTIVLMMTLSLGNVLNAGFDQIFNLYSPVTYSTGDIIDTMVYRIGLLDMQYGVASAVGLFKSVVSCVLIVVSYKLAFKFANYRIF